LTRVSSAQLDATRRDEWPVQCVESKESVGPGFNTLLLVDALMNPDAPRTVAVGTLTTCTSLVLSVLFPFAYRAKPL
jgi:hypothetical protein